MLPGKRLCASLMLLAVFASPAAGKTLEEFSTLFADLAGNAEKADEILQLCDSALAGEAKASPRYMATAHSYRSHAFFLKKDFSAAESAALQAVEADSTSALAHFIYTDVLYELERFDEAKARCLTATELMETDDHKPGLRELCNSTYDTRVAQAGKKDAQSTGTATF